MATSGTERVHDQGGGSGQLGLRAGGAKNFWVKKSRQKRVSRLKIMTYSEMNMYENLKKNLGKPGWYGM